jgi:hypothetical protein
MEEGQEEEVAAHLPAVVDSPAAARGRGGGGVAYGARVHKGIEWRSASGHVFLSRCAVKLLDTHVGRRVLGWIRANPGRAKCTFVPPRGGHLGADSRRGLSSNTRRYTVFQTKT